MKRFRFIAIAIVMMVVLLPISALAGTAGDGIVLTFPDDMIACEPTFHFSTSGVDPSWPVDYAVFIEVAPGQLVEIASGSTVGNLNIDFTPDPLSPGETRVYAVFIAVFVPDKPPTKLNGKWKVTCEEPPGGGQGCTPGYWRQTQHFDSWVPTGYAPGDYYDPTFGVDGSFETLLDAVWARGGGENALARHAVAALLNASHPDVNYAFSTTDVIDMVQDAYASGNFEFVKNQFEYQNELGCPLD